MCIRDRPGEHEHMDPVCLKGAARSGAPVVLEDSGALGEIELLAVVGRHLTADAPEKSAAALLRLGVVDQGFSEDVYKRQPRYWPDPA